MLLEQLMDESFLGLNFRSGSKSPEQKKAQRGNAPQPKIHSESQNHYREQLNTLAQHISDQ